MRVGLLEPASQRVVERLGESRRRVRVAVLGATGYTGGELCAILARHPGVELCAVFGSSARAEAVRFSSLHPQLRGASGPDCGAYSLAALRASLAEVALCATPNETSAEVIGPLLEAGLRVVDLSGAFRLRDEAAYPRWYGFAHPAPSLLSRAVYSVPELLDEAGRAALRHAPLIANPGCYATSVILALQPIAELAHADEAIIADCKSGVSGAGKRADLAYSFTELANNFKTYATGGHRHEPEIRRALGLSDERGFVFVPHLLPVPRGILSTIYVPLAARAEPAQIAARYASVYAAARFVGVRPHGQLPELADVVQTPRCELGFQLLPGERRLLVVSVLDNLLKGAASQAVQNLNLACGLPEAEGL